MLGTLPEKKQKYKGRTGPNIGTCLQCTRNNDSDFSPYYLMFGRKPCPPIDKLFVTNTADLKGTISTKYVENLKKRIECAYKTANEVVKKEQEQNKWHYDHKVRCA